MWRAIKTPCWPIRIHFNSTFIWIFFFFFPFLKYKSTFCPNYTLMERRKKAGWEWGGYWLKAKDGNRFFSDLKRTCKYVEICRQTQYVLKCRFRLWRRNTYTWVTVETRGNESVAVHEQKRSLLHIHFHYCVLNWHMPRIIC